jgi:hypothetical protein
MLLIRADQMRVLARRSLVNRLFLHARDVAPDVCAGMSAEHLRSVVDYCLDRCEHYGITRDYDVLRYLNLMIVFGFTFDKEEPWAAAPLAFRNPSGRMELLMDHALMQNPPSAGGQHGS